ncbi:MAG: hypothetical protein ACXAC8_11410 [Candidatus Hodarchaeales archaeon]|jgi:ribosome biogenesis protein Nip4
MVFQYLSEKESHQIEKAFNQLLNSTEMAHILENKMLIKISGHRKEIYLVSWENLSLLELIATKSLKRTGRIVYAGTKLGFFIHDRFMFGIESINFMAPFIKNKILLDAKNTQKFIYGKEIQIQADQNQNLVENSTIMVFSPNEIPLGYAKILSKNQKLLLHNLVDIGIFLRSEKSAFI